MSFVLLTLIWCFTVYFLDLHMIPLILAQPIQITFVSQFQRFSKNLIKYDLSGSLTVPCHARHNSRTSFAGSVDLSTVNGGSFLHFQIRYKSSKPCLIGHQSLNFHHWQGYNSNNHPWIITPNTRPKVMYIFQKQLD